MGVDGRRGPGADGSPGCGRPSSLRSFLVLVTLLVGLVGALPSAVGAQAIRGAVVEEGSGRPLAGVLVSLLDEDGAAVTRAISDTEGAFVLRASRPGRYAVRGERMGLARQLVEGFSLAPDVELRLRLEMAVAPVSLVGIDVGGQQRCSLEPEAGVAVQRVWDVARSALRANEAVEDLGIYDYDVIRYRRTLDTGSLSVLDESASARRIWSSRPIRSRDLDALLDSGFVVPDAEGTRYYAPDARVLLSDRFLATHCFTLRDGPDGTLGLAFRPVSASPSVPDVAGTLWVDRSSARLLWLDVRYVGLPSPQREVDGSKLGARVDFRQLDDGIWIVSRWRIRMPVVGEERRSWRGRPAYRLMAVTEEGGRVAQARRGEAVVYREPLGMVEGTVTRPGEGVQSPMSVAVLGTGHSAPVGPDGSFRLPGVPEGAYELAILDARLAGLDADVPVESVWLAAGDTVRVDLTPRAPERILDDVCGDIGWSPGRLVLMGRVVAESSGEGLDGARIRVSWRTLTRDGSQSDSPIRVHEWSRRTSSNVLGDFLLCDVASGVAVDVTGRHEGALGRLLLTPPDATLVVNTVLRVPK